MRMDPAACVGHRPGPAQLLSPPERLLRPPDEPEPRGHDTAAEDAGEPEPLGHDTAADDAGEPGGPAPPGDQAA